MADTIEVNTRKFVRDFTEMKHLATTGASVRVVEGGLAWTFQLESRQGGFLGATKGTLVFQAPPEALLSTDEAWEADR